MTHGSGKKVVVAMSGGVDSSVAALLLQQQGYRVVGCFMRLGSEDSVESPDAAGDCRIDLKPQPSGSKLHHQGCCSVNDAADARLVASILDVPFYVLNFRKDFGRIINYFVDEYNAGRTPNPCVRCNDWLKFGKLWDYARSIDADFIATGHYARIDRADPVRPRLLRGLDHGKDQSYVLFGATPDRLGHMLLPIGGMQKSAVRDFAHRHNLPVFDKPDSQEICFVPDNDYAGLIHRRTPDAVAEGDILDTAGRVVGRHPGQQHFTIGQRRGVGVALGHPVYVVDKDPAVNTVTVGVKDDLLSTALAADQTNWLVDPPRDWTPCTAKIRYNTPPVPARVRATPDNTLELRFHDPIPAVTPGQAVVCYDHDHLLGGGWITNAIRS